MDYLDPKKALRHTIILYVGYICIAIGIGIATVILVYQAYGFGLGKNGTVIQNGLVFFASQPHPANLYLDGKLAKDQTNSRLVLPEGIYKAVIARDGYRDWQRTIEVDGGSVHHFDYPLLIPKTLTTKKIGTAYTAAPGLVSQSPDRRWVVVEQAGSLSVFDVYDLKNPSKAPVTVTLPESIVAKDAAGSYTLSEWADDNEHFVLNFTQATGVQQILVDRINTEAAVNLTTTLNTTAQISLRDKKYDQYYIYDKAAATLQAATLKSPTPTPVLEHVLAFKPYRNNTLLYATDTDAPAGKALIKLKTDDQTYQIRTVDANTTYLLDLTGYDGKLYVVAGAASMNKVYIYQDPVGQLHDQPKQAVTPIQVMHLVSPSYLSFSSNAQYIVAESGQQFGVYDIENQTGYNYSAKAPLDAPQLHASWMDGNRLAYVSGGKLNIFDYDNTNRQTLGAADPNYLPAYAPDYRFIYTFTPSGTQSQLGQTSLLTSADQ